MSKFIYILLLLFLLSFSEVFSQPFFGYQSVGRNTVYFSLTWEGEVKLGLGYNSRRGGSPFTDYSAEWRFPLAEVFQTQNHEIIVGVYRPLRLNSRPFVAAGGHLRIQQNQLSSAKRTRYILALTAVPSYTYAFSTNDRPYGTLGARATYLFGILERQKEFGEDGLVDATPFAFHGAELGGHLDLHLERTIGWAANVFMQKYWKLNGEVLTEEEKKWNLEGNTYLGSTYWRF